MQAVCLLQENSSSCSFTDILWLTAICSHTSDLLVPLHKIQRGHKVASVAVWMKWLVSSLFNAQVCRQRCCSRHEDTSSPLACVCAVPSAEMWRAGEGKATRLAPPRYLSSCSWSFPGATERKHTSHLKEIRHVFWEDPRGRPERWRSHLEWQLTPSWLRVLIAGRLVGSFVVFEQGDDRIVSWMGERERRGV